jgi:hypothetical protein
MKPVRSRLALLALCGLSAAFVACGSDDDGDEGPAPTATPTSVPTATAVPQVCEVTPGEWSAPAWETNAADALALRARLDTLVGGDAMRGAEEGTVVIGGVAQLDALYEAGDPSLADVTTPAYDAVMADVFEGFVALVEAGPGDPIDGSGMWAPGPDGGIFGDSMRGIDAGGLELRQLADKGMFSGGAFYNYALSLTEGTVEPATVDAMAAAWGANQDLDPAGSLTDAANYSYQMGFHAEIAAALTAAKAYAADDACTAERDAALVDFFRAWEQSMLARFVYYANRGSSLVDGATGDNDRVEGLHQVAEGIGLALGFLGVPDPASGPLAGAGRVIADEDLDDLMNAVGVDAADLNASTTGELAVDAAAFADAALDVEAVVADVYGLDAAEVESYRTPTAG